MADIARTVGKPEIRIQKSASEVINSPDFKRLVAKRWTVSGILLALLFVTYYGYVMVIGFDKEIFSAKIGEATTLGIPVGIAVIVFAFILTAIYVVWANSKYDPEVERLKNQLKPR